MTSTTKPKLTDYPPALVEALCTYEAYRCWGFQPDDIFAWTMDDGCFAMLLRTQGKEAAVVCGRYSGTKEATGDLWKELAGRWNAREFIDEFPEVFRASTVRNRAAFIITEIVLKAGIQLPVAEGALRLATTWTKPGSASSAEDAPN